MSNPPDFFSVVKGKYPLFRLWEAPTFAPKISWTIFVDGSLGVNQHALLRRVIGENLTAFNSMTSHSANITKDMEANTSPDRLLQVDDYSLKPQEFEALNLFQKFTFQVLSNEHLMGRDGTLYGMQICSAQPVFIIEWWEEGPSEWHELTDWAARTRKYLSALIDNRH